MVEQILRVILELSIGVQRKTAAEAFGGAPVQVAWHEIDTSRAAPRDLVRGKLVAPGKRVPDARIVVTRGRRTFEAIEAFRVLLPARDHGRPEMFQRLDVVRVERECAPRERHALRHVARFVTFACLREEGSRFVGLRQLSASTSFSSSSSVNTRNEDVRTLPWLLTDIETRDIVSSSGASATTT